MNKTLGNLLLVLGTVIGGIAAAGSEKASRDIDLTGAASFPGEYLFDETGGFDEGTELGAEVVSSLASSGLTTVAVRTPPKNEEDIAGRDTAGLTGRVLAKDLSLGHRIGSPSRPVASSPTP